jgi:hypothetical protein
MKRNVLNFWIILLLAGTLLLSQDLAGQVIEVNGFAGWQFGGKVGLYDGDFRINDAMNYGGKLAFGLSTTTYAEVSYMRADTEGQFIYFNGTRGEIIEFSSNYIHIGGVQESSMGFISPFATIGLGMAIWSPKDPQYNSKAQFSVTAGAGFKIWLTDFLGIRVQGSVLMPMVFNGVGFGCGIGTGGSSCGTNVYTRIVPFQGEFSGGLIFKISKN